MPQELDDIMSGQGEPSPVSDTQEQVDDQGQPRDEQGRFAGKSEGQGPEQAQQPEPEQTQPVMVPIQSLDARLAKADEKYTALEAQFQLTQRQLQQLLSQQQRQPAQEPAPAPDWLENPAGFVQHNARELIDPVRQEINERLMFNARLTAEAVHGKEKMTTALTAFDNAVASGQVDQRDVARVYQSPNPFHEAVQWHAKSSALTRYGDDPEAFINAEVERRVAALNGGQSQPQTPRPAPSNGRMVMPSDFATTRNSGSRTAPQYDGPKPLSEVMNR